ncbi:MAG: class I SAM-dependent methyltransferase [Steroidobacteraceae bacterium]
MTDATEQGYSYYTSSTPTAKSAVSRSNCEKLGQARLFPSFSDVDYLIFELRRPIVERWLARFDDPHLALLDIGGRIQPYRALLQGRIDCYIAVDLLFEGLVDVVATGERLPFKRDAFDLVLCNDALQYIPHPENAISEIHRVLRPAGGLILSTRASYPGHHDEYWRFVPQALRFLTRSFSSVTIEPEGNSVTGWATFTNVLLHRDIQSYRLNRIAQLTTIPLINVVGLWLGRYVSRNTRGTCGYSLLAIK